MVLVRQVFQIKFGYMDQVMAAFKEDMTGGDDGPLHTSRILTDISGDNFTLVIETKADSVDAFMDALQASFEDQEMSAQANEAMRYIESGRKEFYTIEYEAE